MIALENNVDIRIERENIRLSELNAIFEDAQFDPTLRFDVQADQTIQNTASTIETQALGTDQLKQTSQRLQAGIEQRLRWGGDYDLSVMEVRSSRTRQALNPIFFGNAILTVTQPLLKGFGPQVTQGPLRIAQTDIAISRAAFRVTVSSLLVDISSAYWDLVFQRENLKIKQQALQSAQQLLEANRAKVNLGLLAPIEILVAEAGAASRQESVVVAEKEVEDKEDELRQLLNLPEQSMVHPPSLQPTDTPMNTRKRFEKEKVLNTALTQRPEIAENRLNLRNRELLVRMARNRLAPSLDFVGSVGLNGLGTSYSDEFNKLGSGNFYQWEAGVVLRFPIGNRDARANLQKEKVEQNKAILAQTKVVQQITLEVKKALRRVRTDFQRIETTRRATVLAEQKLSAGQERFSLGLISSNDLLEFQDELSDARGKELKAIIDYNKSLTHLERVTGTLIERFGIETLS